MTKAHIRVTMADGKVARRELVVDGHTICELSWVEVMELAMNAVSTLRWDKR